MSELTEFAVYMGVVGYAFGATAAAAIASELQVARDKAVAIATFWPFVLVGLLVIGLYRGAIYWTVNMTRFAKRARPAKKIAPSDPLIEAARREVELIAPTQED